MSSSPRSLGPGALAAAVALALLLSGCASPAGGDPRSAQSPIAATPPESPASPFSAGGLQDPRAGSPAGAAADATKATPTGVRIPSIGVESSLEDLVIDAEGRLSAPVDYDLAGWYAGGVAPGQIGPAIIAGHVDSPTAPAVFARLGELAPGAEIIVAMSDGSELAFRMTGSMQSAKAEFPTADVYSNVPAPELRLITCAGDFDSSIGHYTDNLIVFATGA